MYREEIKRWGVVHVLTKGKCIIIYGKRCDKIPLTKINHISYNNLTFCCRPQPEVLSEANVRAAEKTSVIVLAAGAVRALWKCPCTTALGVPGVKISEHRERSGAFNRRELYD